MIVIWYLVLNFSNGGTVAIPQLDAVQCDTNAKWVNTRMLGMSSQAFCVQGVALPLPK